MNPIDMIHGQAADCLAMQKQMKAINKYYRRHRTCVGFPGIGKNEAADLDKRVAEDPIGLKAGPFAARELANLRSRTQRLILQLQKLQDAKMDAEGVKADA